jgi:hypothetical protein
MYTTKSTSRLIATRTDGDQVAVLIYDGGVLVVEIELSPRRAVRLGLDLLNIAAGSVFALRPRP